MPLDNLILDVDDQIIKIRTKNLDVSFNELYDMYQNGELIIDPDYQRLFRWEISKQSRFIESLILEMPVPPIFVIEKSDGIYELIDGLQRISSYLRFRGIDLQSGIDKLDDPDSNSGNSVFLEGCDIVPDLNGYCYDTLPKSLQIKLKRSFVRMEVIKKESEPSLKYHMFKRLNTGGDLLSDQEIRNCTIRLLGSEGISFLEKCSKNPDFINVISRLDEEKLKRKYDQELVLRFFAIKNNLQNYRYPVTEYLTNYLEKMTLDGQFAYEKEEMIFNKTFKWINECWGEDAFSPKTVNGYYRNEFALYLFDGISIPIANNIDVINPNNIGDIITSVETVKFGEQIKQYKTGSVNGLKTRIKMFTEGVKRAIEP
ncbi:MAG: DUF262 domain-containing protein [Lachnospiraceae bacterium]|nr:DUF262 domain-containing protein [Lachnospiraceae bacterium]